MPAGTVRRMVRPTVIAEDRYRSILIENDIIAIFQLNNAQFVITNETLEFGFNLRLFKDLRSSSTDMEGAHGELSAWFAD